MPIRSDEDERREEERLLKASGDAAGDGCGVCGREQLWNGERTSVGIFRGKVRQAGECCAHRIRSPIALGIYYGGPNPPWLEDDRLWFENNPTRSYRFRGGFAGETAHGFIIDNKKAQDGKRYIKGREVYDCDWVIVHQLTPGTRQRMPLRLDTGDNDIFKAILRLDLDSQEAFAEVVYRDANDRTGGMRESSIPLKQAIRIATKLLKQKGAK